MKTQEDIDFLAMETVEEIGASPHSLEYIKGQLLKAVECASDENVAPATIDINGRTFNKCCISDKQFNECITPCVFCHSIVQEHCKEPYRFCGDEQVCYIDLGAIYGEDVCDAMSKEQKVIPTQMATQKDFTCGDCEEYCSFAEHKCLLNKCFVSSAERACDHFIKKEE